MTRIKTSKRRNKTRQERLADVLSFLDSQMEVTSYSVARNLSISQRYAFDLLAQLVQEGRAVATPMYHRMNSSKWIVRSIDNGQ